MKLENNKWYLINGTPCEYINGVFFWQSEDGTKFFHASDLKGTDAKIEPMNK